jgi:hypothetical protein
MTATLRIEGDDVEGEVALAIAPGTVKKAQDRALDEALRGPLDEAAASLGVLLAAAPSSFARALPGKDDAGRTRFAVRGRVEGDRLVPIRRPR